MPLLLEIVTPERRVYEKTVDMVNLPTTTGEIGVLPGHLPLITELSPGTLAVTSPEGLENLAVGKGFARIEGDVVSVLAESAISEEAIDESAVLRAMEAAQKALATAAELDPEEQDQLESLVRFATAQLALKGKKRR